MKKSYVSVSVQEKITSIICEALISGNGRDICIIWNDNIFKTGKMRTQTFLFSEIFNKHMNLSNMFLKWAKQQQIAKLGFSVKTFTDVQTRTIRMDYVHVELNNTIADYRRGDLSEKYLNSSIKAWEAEKSRMYSLGLWETWAKDNNLRKLISAIELV